jgi:hypothetical protein
MEFSDSLGVVIGDPINHHPFIAATQNRGESWVNISENFTNTFSTGEAFFAASGTNIALSSFPGTQVPDLLLVSGGTQSNLYRNRKEPYPLPIIQGKESTGANSIDMYKNKGVIVGGDFANDKDTTQNCVLFDFNPDIKNEYSKNKDTVSVSIEISFRPKIKFTHPQTPPHGYRSCVLFINENILSACGTSGVDISEDGGMNWQLISNESFHVVRKAKQGTAVYLAGIDGKIAKLKK